MAKREKANRWIIAVSVCFGFTLIYALIAAYLSKKRGIHLPPEWFLLGVALLSGLMTMVAVKQGRFRFGCTRSETPVFFWAQVIFGYLISAVLAATILYRLLR